MRALTLTQPYAGLVASGIKLVENRPRSIIKREDFGEPFAIHASREIDESVYARIIEIAPWLSWTEVNREHAAWWPLSRITTAIIGVATIEAVVVHFTRTDGSAYAVDVATGTVRDLGDQRRWFHGPIGYVLRDVRALVTPIPCRGFQGFWTLTDDVSAKVRAQLQPRPRTDGSL